MRRSLLPLLLVTAATAYRLPPLRVSAAAREALLRMEQGSEEDTITPERRKFEAGRGNLFFTSPTPRTGEQGLDPVLSKEDMQMSEGLGWGQWALILLGLLTGLYLLTALVVL